MGIVNQRDLPLGAIEFTLEHVADLISRSRELISDERRWIAGHFIFVRRTFAFGEDPAACTDVRMCAVGAVIAVRWDGTITEVSCSGPDDCVGGGELNDTCGRITENADALESKFSDPLFAAACGYLNRAASELNSGASEWPIIAFNDSLPTQDRYDPVKVRAHLNKVLGVFDAAHDQVLRDAAQLELGT